MTDKDIIKALEWLEEIKGFCSSEEKYIYATTLVDLINRHQAEIKRLRKEVNLVSIQFQDLQERYEEAQAEIERLKKVYQANQQLINALNKSYFLAKVEAIKEFARKLKCGVPQETGVIHCADVDKLVKEMVGDNNEI